LHAWKVLKKVHTHAVIDLVDGIAIDDQHELMIQHQDHYDDSVHFNARGAELQGDQAADAIKAVLGSVQP
jgi:hypothetical protein